MFNLINNASVKNSKNDFLSGLTVALALVPEAVAFALVAHVHPLVGLYAAFIVGLITSLIGGRPGMISGATGALAVVMVSLVVSHGVEYLFATVVLMGVIQMLFGIFRLGKFIRLVPHPVFLGFVNGLAIVILLAQIDHFKTADGAWLDANSLGIMAALIMLTMAIIYLLPKFTKIIPATLASILVGSFTVIFFNIDTKTVSDMASIAGGLPQFHIPIVPLSLETLYIIFPYAIILALVGLIESLLTLNLIDDLTQTTGKPNQECLGQGVANTVTGFFGGMGGCAMVGQSMINVKSGGRGRLSGFMAAIFLLSFILLLSSWIEQIPLAILVGVMFVVVIGTFEWCSLRLISRIPLSDSIIGISVAVITVFTDLAIAVISGVVMSALVFSWKHAKQIVATSHINDDTGIKTYVLDGLLFFASTRNFHALFDPKHDPKDVYVDFANSKVMDHSAIQAIDKLASSYNQYNKTLHLLHLSLECRELLNTAKNLVEVNVLEDPTYHIAKDG